MPLSDYLVGLIFAAVTFGAVTAATFWIVRRCLPELRGAPLVAGAALVFTATLIVVHLLPLALGILTRGTVVGAALLAALAASRLRDAAAPPAPPDPAPPPSGRALSVLAALAVAAVAVYMAAYLGEFAPTASPSIDFTHFHLPGVARWLQTGTVWRNNEFIPLFYTGTYPNNGDIVFLAALLPWRNDAFVRLTCVPYLALIGVTIYAIAGELRAPRAAGALFAAVGVATPTLLVTSIDRLKPDSIMLACFGAGVLFLLRHVRTRRRADLVLAGLGLGLAFGARWNAAAEVAAVVATWAAASWIAGRDVRTVVRDGAVLTGLIAAAGGFWFVRNLVVTGNPVFPVKVAPLGVTVFDAPPDVVGDRFGLSVAHYLTNWHVLDRFVLPDYREAFGLPGILLGIGLLFAVVLAIRFRGGGRRGYTVAPATVIPVAVATVAILVIYVVAPISAQGSEGHPWTGIIRENTRLALPAIVLGAALAAWVTGRIGRLAPAVGVVGLVAVVDGLGQSPFVHTRHLVVAALVLAAAAGAVGGLVALRRRGGVSLSRPPAAAVGLAIVVALAGVVAAGQRGQKHFNDRRYRGVSATTDWLNSHAPAGHRVGIAGEFVNVVTTLPMFGPRFHNHVAYVGPIVRGMLREYSAPGPFLRALKGGRYDLLLVGRGIVPGDGGPAERWATRAGYVPVARSWSDVLFRRPS